MSLSTIVGLSRTFASFGDLMDHLTNNETMFLINYELKLNMGKHTYYQIGDMFWCYDSATITDWNNRFHIYFLKASDVCVMTKTKSFMTVDGAEAHTYELSWFFLSGHGSGIQTTLCEIMNYKYIDIEDIDYQYTRTKNEIMNFLKKYLLKEDESEMNDENLGSVGNMVVDNDLTHKESSTSGNEYHNLPLYDKIKERMESIPLSFIPEDNHGMTNTSPSTNTVSVRWFDDYLEKFEATEVRFGRYFLWMILTNGSERYIPLTQVRWFSQSIESHEKTESH